MSVLKSHWICNLGTEIHQLLLSYNNLAIHKAKVACLCNELNNFSKQILPRVKTDEQVTPVQNVMLRELMQCIHNLKILFSQFTPNTLAETLLRESPTSAGEKLNNFRQTFNKIVKDLGICNYDPCPLDDAQLKVDDSDDVNVIVMYLGKLATSSRTIIEQQEYTRKLNEYKEIQKKYQEEEEKSQIQKNEESRIMTQEEINSRVTDLADYSVNFDDFELQAKIGNGAFAEVFLSYQKSTHKMVALKKLFNQQFTVKEFEMFLREIKIFQKLQHFAVLQFVGVCLRPPFCIATEYMSGGSLFTRLHNGSELYGTKLTIIALGVAIGMAHLHDNNMIHRDLKSTNVLLDADDFPRICDFGMSREMAGPNDPPMSGGVGTAQWMAPEVIQYQKYDQKADVYSYGILLWELLTREVPFQGLNNVQIAIAVTNRDSRPLIPQSCPPKLSQLIKICWDKDPNKRPDFKMITKAFESGEISFPGTEQEFVQAYVNQFSKVETKSTEFNPENVSKESVQQIIKEINDPNKRDDGISKMLSIKEVHLWTKLLNEAGIVPILLDLISRCNLANSAFNLIHCLSLILSDEEVVKEFIELSGSRTVLDLFIKYGTTSMIGIIDCLTCIVNNDKLVQFSTEHFTKLSSFLVSNDLRIRIDTTKLILSILENHSYDEDISLNSLISNVICNIRPGARTELLTVSLKLLNEMLELPKLFTSIIHSDTPITVYSLITNNNKDENVQIEALKLLKKMFQGMRPSMNIVSMFVKGFSDIINTNQNNFNLISLLLIVLATLLKSPIIFKEINECETILESFKFCFKCESTKVIIYSLKICYAILNNIITFEMFSKLGNDLIPLLINTKSESITLLSASCLISILHNNEDNKEILKNGSNEIKQFLNNSLTSNKSMNAEIGLRLSGIISSTFSGAIFLEKNNIIPKVCNLCNSKEDENRKLSFISIASHSLSYPMSNSIIDFIPSILNVINDDSIFPYPLITIVNLVINPKAVISCIPFLEKLIPLLDVNEEENKSRVLTALHRIVLTHEGIKYYKDKNVLLKLLNKISNLLETQYSRLAFEIIEGIAQIKIGREALIEAKMKQYFLDNLKLMQTTDPLREMFLRIYSRIEEEC